jgi:hypothetical protein
VDGLSQDCEENIVQDHPSWHQDYFSLVDELPILNK